MTLQLGFSHPVEMTPPDGVEIEEARFFDVDELPSLPPSVSISRRMINAVAAKLARGEQP